MHTRQIFQTDNPLRWKAIVWTFRISLLVVLLGIATATLAILKHSYPKLPRITGYEGNFKPLQHPAAPLTFKSATSTKKIKPKPLALRPSGDGKQQIRAGFYVNWDLQSYFSLKNNIGKMNMVLPEWLFIDPTADTILLQTDPKAFRLMDSSHVKIVPLLTNNYGDRWNHEAVTRIVESPKKTRIFIHQLITILKQNHFDGVSVDFEDLYSLKNDQHLVNFHMQLYDSLHANGLLASQCIPPFNEDYRLSELHRFNDYIFVMAYDEHNSSTLPGAISSAGWVENVLDIFTDKIESGKFVLCLAGYGYDWLQGSTGLDITFQEAVTTAKSANAKVLFDDHNYNAHFTYTDNENRPHEVWFADAATNFNMMRCAANYGLAGVAVWRLGSEDPRLWTFYNRNLNDDSLAQFPFPVEGMEHIKGNNDIDYIGEGEVLDILSTPQDGTIKLAYNNKDRLISEENYLSYPSNYVIKKYGQHTTPTIVLTFDDGPDPRYTPAILDILKKEKVPAAFFMIGRNMENNIPLVKQVYDAGYEIGNHTYSHPNLAEVSNNRAWLEINSTRKLLEIITGHSTILFRPPYNADAEPQSLVEIIPVAQSREENYLTVGESIDPQDWDARVNADTIFNRIVAQEKLGSILLLHDSGGDRTATIQALPRIIHYFKQKGYRFATVGELLNKNRAELMPPVVSPDDRLLNKAGFLVASGIYWLQHLLYALFFAAIFLTLGRMLVMGLLAYIQNARSKKQAISKQQPFVSILVPAYNESVNAVTTLQNLLQTNYPHYEILFVNDGSTDDTYQQVQNAFSKERRIRLFTKTNGGKASALNYGLAQAKGDFVVCIDADTRLLPDAVSRLMESFTDEKTGAVAGNVKVGNRINLLTEWQAIEYITAQNFDRRAYDLLNCITVVPGAIGAFRKEAIEKAGGFTTDTLAEDCDLTIRILRKGYRVRNNVNAIALTESPETLSQFLKQRFRWMYGVMQTLYKHRDALWKPRFKALGLVALPNILVFQFILPLFAPIADTMMLTGLITGGAEKIILYYLAFQVVDLLASAMAFGFEKERRDKLFLLLLQRFTYRWLMYYVLIKALLRAAKGELQNWGVLQRTGNVQLGNTA